MEALFSPTNITFFHRGTSMQKSWFSPSNIRCRAGAKRQDRAGDVMPWIWKDTFFEVPFTLIVLDGSFSHKTHINQAAMKQTNEFCLQFLFLSCFKLEGWLGTETKPRPHLIHGFHFFEMLFFRLTHTSRNHEPMFVMSTVHIYIYIQYYIILYTGWWFQPLWKILINGKDYPIYQGK